MKLLVTLDDNSCNNRWGNRYLPDVVLVANCLFPLTEFVYFHELWKIFNRELIFIIRYGIDNKFTHLPDSSTQFVILDSLST